MTTQQISEYLNKYNIINKELLAEHILQLKINTIPNVGLISELVFVLEDEFSVFNSFLAENKFQESLGWQMKRGKVIIYDNSAKTNKTEEKVNRLIEEEIERQKFEKEAEIEYTGVLGTGMFFVLYPMLLGDWEKDKNKFLDIYNKLKQTREEYIKNNTPMFLDEILSQKNTNSTRHKSKDGESPSCPIGWAESDIFGIKSCIKTDVKVVSEIRDSSFPQKTEKQGIKDSQKEVKAPIFTYCKVNKNALEKLALRAQYGHVKYNDKGQDEDWQNFTRVQNGDFEYSNSQFRHALEIGEEDEEGHLVSGAWNAIARLEIYLRNK